MNHIDGICFIRNHGQAHVRVELTIPLHKDFFVKTSIAQVFFCRVL